MKQYSFLSEEKALSAIGKFFAPKGVGNLLTATAVGGLVGHSVGGFVGFLYGCKVYKDRKRTLDEMDKKLDDPDVSIYTRRKILDAKNIMQSMSDEEYKKYIISDYYAKGRDIGGTIGGLAGGIFQKFM